MITGYWELGSLGAGELGKLGKLANTLKGDDRAKYGDKKVDNLADDLGMTSVNLYKAMQFNRLFGKDEFSNVLEKGLSCRHVTYPLSVKDPKQRMKLIEEISKESLSSDDVRQEVKRSKGKVQDGRGRKKEYSFDMFYKRVAKIGEWLDDEFMGAFDIGDRKIKDAEIKQLEVVFDRIGIILGKVK